MNKRLIYALLGSVLLFSCLFPTAAQAQQEELQGLLNRKKYQEVIRQTDSLQQAGTLSLPMLYIAGQAYDGVMKYRNAYTCYKNCYEQDTANVEYLTAYARAAGTLGRVAEAEDLYLRLLEIDEFDFNTNYQLGRLYFQAGDYTMAYIYFQIVSSIDPENGLIWRYMGDCLVRGGNLRFAVEYCYPDAFKYNPENISIATAYVNTLLRYDPATVGLALAICDSALTYNPDSRLLQQNQAMCLYVDKQYDKADSVYTQLLVELDSSYTTLKYAGASRYYAKKYFLAIDPLEVAYNLDTTAVDVPLFLGYCYAKTYDRKLGLQFLDKAAQNMEPDKQYVNMLNLGRIEAYQRDANPEPAIRIYYQMYQEDPTRSGLLQSILRLYARMAPDLTKTTDEKLRQKVLFSAVASVRRRFKDKASREEHVNDGYIKKALKDIHEEMFFRSLKEYTMIAPDGRQSKITFEELKELIDSIPEPTRRIPPPPPPAPGTDSTTVKIQQ